MPDQQLNFKAWIENNNGSGGGRLHVHGEVMVADKTLMYELGKKDVQGYFPDELFLEIKPDPTPGSERVEIKYHEELSNKDGYKKITIYAKNEQVFEINQVEKKA